MQPKINFSRLSSIRAVLFDLDGTLLDTAPDLIFTLDCLLQENNLAMTENESLRSLVGLGAKTLIKHSFNIAEDDPRLNLLRERFISLYEEHLTDTTQLFPHMEKVLTYLETAGIPWGVVTNKLTRHTLHLLEALNLKTRAACIVCGDTLATYKPDPAPIIHACQLLKLSPEHCVYVGDTLIDVTASKKAGTKSLVALYGYRYAHEDPYTWQADGYVEEPIEIIEWV